MLKVLKSKDGMAFPMMMIMATVGIILLTAMVSLSYQNYRNINASNTRSNAYYIADYGTEKVIKNLETVVESAKNYANEAMRKSNGATPSEYDTLVSLDLTKDQFQQEYKAKYISHYLEFLRDTVPGYSGPNRGYKAAQTTNGGNDYVLLGSGTVLTNAFYKATVTETATFNSDFLLNIEVTGKMDSSATDDKPVYVRKVSAQIGVDPWGYNSSSTASDLNTNENIVYSSPQWASGIASAGDVLVQGGQVVVDGDIFVNGTNPGNDPVTGQAREGMEYGGIVVGKTGRGDLLVKGNIFSNNYVHTMYPGSTIRVQQRSTIPPGTYNSGVDQIYNNNTTNSGYSESSANLNLNGNNPLDVDPALLGTINGKLTSAARYEVYVNGFRVRTNTFAYDPNDKYINYLKDTYYTQKKYGGFVYANNVQIEKNDGGVASPASQTIDIAGSAIIYDNLQTDGKGDIYLGHNFYGFKGGLVKFNESSSIITNHPEGIIHIGKRMYNAGVAYVTAYNGANQPYKTGDSATIYRNFYSYRMPYFNDAAHPMMDYGPFSFETLTDIIERIKHIFKYNADTNSPTDTTIKDGGNMLDKSMIKLNQSIYSTGLFNSSDMGYSEGVVTGETTGGASFMGFVNADAGIPADSLHYETLVTPNRATKGLNQNAFYYSIRDKYSILNTLKALKSENGHALTVNDLVDTSALSGSVSYKSPTNYPASFVVSSGDINVTVSGGNVYITGDGISPFTSSDRDNGLPAFNGAIVSTGGKITINSGSDLKINGAVISASSDGVEFVGGGKKIISFDKKIMLNIFKLPIDDAVKVKKLLTNKRGSVEMLRALYYNTHPAPGVTLVPIDDFQESVGYVMSANGLPNLEETFEFIANKYEIIDSDQEMTDKNILYKDVLASLLGEGSKNYKILKWNATQ